MNNRIEELQKTVNDARAELEVFEAAERKKRFSKLLGRCFKYRNSYGSDSKWWLYAKVTGDDGYWPRTFSFQVTDRQEVGFKNNDQSSHIGGDSWTPISATEFRKELKKALALATKYAEKALT